MSLIITHHQALAKTSELLGRMSETGFEVSAAEQYRWDRCAEIKEDQYRQIADINLYAGAAALMLSLSAAMMRTPALSQLLPVVSPDMLDTAAAKGTEFGRTYYSTHKQADMQRWQHGEEGARRELQEKEDIIRALNQLRDRATNTNHEVLQVLANSLKITAVNA